MPIPRKIFQKGEKIGVFTFIKDLPDIVVHKRAYRKFVLQCFCGKKVERRMNGIKYLRSCGCQEHENRSNGISKHGLTRKEFWHPYYKTVSGVYERCYNPDSQFYHCYGGRGIKVFYERINNFPLFTKRLDENLPPKQKGESLDRINCDGDYEPGNLRWADSKTQQNNKTTNLRIEYNGKTQTLMQRAEETGIKRGTIGYRYHKLGLRGKDLFTPLFPNGKGNKTI